MKCTIGLQCTDFLVHFGNHLDLQNCVTPEMGLPVFTLQCFYCQEIMAEYRSKETQRKTVRGPQTKIPQDFSQSRYSEYKILIKVTLKLSDWSSNLEIIQ